MNDHNFHAFATAISQRVRQLSAAGPLYVTDTDPELLYNLYLDSFDPADNPIYRTNRVYDCSCCRSFIKRMGNVVSINPDGTLESIWGVNVPEPFTQVAAALNTAVTNAPVIKVFSYVDTAIGKPHTFEDQGDHIHEWEHFSCTLPPNWSCSDGLERNKRESRFTSLVGVIQRGLIEITPQALNTVIELCESNQLYRGAQQTKLVKEFRTEQQKFQSFSIVLAAENYVWTLHTKPSLAVRNTSIGQLLQDLSADMPVEDAVRRYEAMVAPANYKRPKSLITESMIDRALTTIDELGYRDSLARRCATASDLSVNNVLFVNRSTESVMKDALRASLMQEAVSKPKNIDGSNHTTVLDFFATHLQGATKVEVLFEPQHTGNLATLTTTIDPTAKPLFHWPSPVAWSYRGNITDSVKERVRKAGGDVEGYGRVSLSWFNRDDLDLHVIEPSGAHIYYGDKHPVNARGSLDVDQNVSNPHPGAVENITWPDRSMLSGEYHVFINNFTRRESHDVGFEVEFEIAGVNRTFNYPKPLGRDKSQPVCRFLMLAGQLSSFTVSTDVQPGLCQSEEWGIKTNDFHEVNLIVESPNYWSTAVGNKHWFFILRNCANPDPVRGVYNEFLTPALHDHRKVLEVLGSKTMCQPTADQLSGLGFSSTIGNQLVVRVTTPSTVKTYKVQF